MNLNDGCVDRSGGKERGVLEHRADYPVVAKPGMVEDRHAGLVKLDFQEPGRAKAGRIAKAIAQRARAKSNRLGRICTLPADEREPSGIACSASRALA